MKNKIFQLIEKLSYPIIVINENNICFINSYFKEYFLSNYNIEFSNLIKINYEWDLYFTKQKLVVINHNTSITILGSKSSEFKEAINHTDKIFRIYRIDKVINPTQ